VPAFDHIFVVVEENTAYSQVIGSSAAPYLNALAQQYGLATNYHAIRHPSLPNYLALIGGDTFGVSSDCPAVGSGACQIDAVNLADRIEAAGREWGAYFETMHTPCDTSISANHDPFMHFDDIRTATLRCARHILPYASLSADLASAATTPDFVFISANDSHNMHTGSIAAGDAWLQDNLAAVFASPAWTTQRSLLVITWDEDDGSEGNRVATILVGSAVRSGFDSATAYTHYSLLRTIEAAWGLAPLTTNDRNAGTMSEFFR
jgi:phospholipase C